MKNVVAKEDGNDSMVDAFGLIIVVAMWIVIAFVAIIIAICINNAWVAAWGILGGTIVACVLQRSFNKRWRDRPQ